jgi:hypothetical protein
LVSAEKNGLFSIFIPNQRQGGTIWPKLAKQKKIILILTCSRVLLGNFLKKLSRLFFVVEMKGEVEILSFFF